LEIAVGIIICCYYYTIILIQSYTLYVCRQRLSWAIPYSSLIGPCRSTASNIYGLIKKNIFKVKKNLRPYVKPSKIGF